MNKSMIISIEGNIGSGKSTLVNLLNEKFNNSQMHFLSEPVDEWSNFVDENGENILTKFYKNQEKYSFTFQIMAYISRLNKLKMKIEELNMTNQSNNIIITERSLSTDKYVFAQMLYDDNKMEKIQLDIYNKWFHSFNKETTVNKIIYIQTEPDVCNRRINKRNRSGEENIPLEYLQNCHHYHENMMDIERKEGKEILILDGNNNVYDDNVLNDWFKQISKFININTTSHEHFSNKPCLCCA
jgi:deoxyadenosine/deoxycytidine kinase